MKFPNHILLDWRSLNTDVSSRYWLFKYLINENKINSHEVFFNFILKKKIQHKKTNLNSLLKNQSQYTVTYSNNSPLRFFKKNSFNSYENFFFNNFKVKHRSLYYSAVERKIYDFINQNNKIYGFPLSRFFKIFANNQIVVNSADNSLWNVFDIHFLRKEKIYTKLKYSRVPQYDIVSGGAAALFAGFLGFLICEKFGFELLDSGDFYILMMYGVFFCFFSKLFLKLFTSNSFNWSSISIKWFFSFYKIIFYLLLNFIRVIFNKIK